MKLTKVGLLARRFVSFLLSLCMMITTMINGITTVFATDPEDGTSSAVGEPTEKIIAESRKADPNTMDDYQTRLLTAKDGSRFAGRVWSDKSVFAYNASDPGQADENNQIKLDMKTDGYDGSVGYSSDFAHVFSALTSSQVINQYPPQPLDVMFVLDVSGSMGRDSAGNVALQDNEHPEDKTNNTFNDSAIYKTVDAINKSINQLLKANEDSRFGIVIYGSTAAVLVPLGHYKIEENLESNPYLKTEYIESYGNSTGGLHFNLTATVTPKEEGESKVTYYADNAGQSNNKAHNVVESETGGGNRTYDGTGGKTEGDGKTESTKFHVGHITNPQAGLAAAMDQFITENEELTWTIETDEDTEEMYARLPALIHLTDGQASDLAWIQPEAKEDGKDWENTISNWNNVNWNYDLAYNSPRNGVEESGKNYYNASQLTGYGDAVPVILQTLMTAAYYKTAVEAYYNSSKVTDEDGNSSQVKDRNGNEVSLTCYSIYASDTNGYENLELDDEKQQVKATVDSILGPEEFFHDYLVEDKENDSFDKDSTYSQFIDKAYELYKQWKDNGSINNSIFTKNTTSPNESINDITITLNISDSQINTGKYSQEANQEWNKNITKEEINKNINYVETDNFYQTGFGNIENIFDKIIDLLLGKVFVPVQGDNDAGVGDSITYQDPLGEYMEIKNQSIYATPHHSPYISGKDYTGSESTYDMSLLLFGEMHGLVRAGVYDYKWNDDYMKALAKTNPDITPGETNFTEGWYNGEATDKNLKYGEDGTVPVTAGKTYETPAEARADGWVYRLNHTTAAQYISVLSEVEKPDDISEQMKNTVYTVYRFDCNDADDRDQLRRNPIYGEVPESIKNQWETYKEEEGRYPIDNTIYKDVDGVYRLSDIRVWIEETGDYTDTEGAITPNTGYDRSLYVNIPIAALPTELATISLGEHGETAYETNLGSDHIGENTDTYNNYCAQSTPFRLFYAVGLEDDLIIKDNSGNQTGVDFNKISAEYLTEHMVHEVDEDNNPIEDKNYTWFISNYYSNTPYEEYVTDSENLASRTRGDPTVTFSPNESNRYYVFQKPLPLYAHAYRVQPDGSLKAVDNDNVVLWDSSKNNLGGNGKTTWEIYGDDETPQSPGSWIGGEYMGTYSSEQSFKDKRPDEGSGTITDDNGGTYKYVENGIVFLQQDLLQHVTSSPESNTFESGSVSFSSDDYFFILIEYYLPEEGEIEINEQTLRKGRLVQYVLARKGSEFGSAFKSDLIDNGDMLCWTDMNGNFAKEFQYLSKNASGDRTRGEPTYKKLTTNDSESLKAYLRDDCEIDPNYTIEIEDPDNPEKTRTVNFLDNQVQYWLNLQNEYKSLLKKEDGSSISETDFNNIFKFAVAARPGGIRTGDMFNNRQTKSSNTTSTSYSYYLPSVSDNSGTDDNVIIDNYLGNNGYMEIANQMLHVTKMIETPENGDLTADDTDEEFNYQLYVQGVTGERTATLTLYNDYTGSWERELAYVDVLTDNSNILRNNDGTRAIFQLATDTVGNKSGQLLVPETGVNGKTVYYLADENGNASKTEALVQNLNELYYLYLPSNTEDGNARRLYQDPNYSQPEYADAVENTQLKTNGRTTFVTRNDFTDVRNSRLANGIMDRYSLAESGAEPGSKSYWVTDAELIPAGYVTPSLVNSEEPNAAATDAWIHKSITPESNEQEINEVNSYVHLDEQSFVIRRPNIESSATNFSSPFRTRTLYMTEKIIFGQNENEDDGSEDEDGEMTSNDLYDQTIPSNDRPDLFDSITKDQIAKNTAEFTLKPGTGLLITGLDNRIPYRFTEKLTDDQIDQGYEVKEVVHTQQVGSQSIYKPGKQEIPVYSYQEAPYADFYSTSKYKSEKTPYGLTWAVNQSGKKNKDDYLSYEPFNHTNAVMWEYYSTIGKTDQASNHHYSIDSVAPDSVYMYVGDSEKTDESLKYKQNPNCKPVSDGGCDEEITSEDGTKQIKHYIYKDGDLIDSHYEGEQPSYIRSMSRYLVSPTVHFATEEEAEEEYDFNSIPASGSTNYTGVYSVFGNTGWFEEQTHFTNTIQKDKKEKSINDTDIPSTDNPLKPGVQAGDEITYEINWSNDGSKDNHVVVIDPLDEGVQFLASKSDEGWIEFKSQEEANSYLKDTLKLNFELNQKDTDHYVIYDLKQQKPGASGVLKLTVKVKEDAADYWEYGKSSDSKDYLVRNKAIIHVGNNAFYTNEEDNPVGEPDKDETQIKRNQDESVISPKEGQEKFDLTDSNDDGILEGPEVYVGDEITYKISWRNYENESALITIRDPLDENVKLISAKFDPKNTAFENTDLGSSELESESGLPVGYEGAKEASITPASSDYQKPGDTNSEPIVVDIDPSTEGVSEVPVIQYTKGSDNKADTVIWNLGIQPAGASGYVTLVVQVLPGATPVGKVDNTAYVKVDGDWEQQTKTIENPTPKVDKEETSVNGNPEKREGSLVKVGDTINYQINWDRGQEQKDYLDKIEITDPLDPGVDFVEASYTFNGTTYTLDDKNTEKKIQSSTDNPIVTIEYDSEHHQVKWLLQGNAAVKVGSVSVKVLVTTRALKQGKFLNLEDPKDGEDPIGSASDWDYRNAYGLEANGYVQEVQDRGAVKFEDDPTLVTDLVENPLTPDKEEVSIDGEQGPDIELNGSPVKVGSQIGFRIAYQNYNETGTHRVIIRDPLDMGFDFVEASAENLETVPAANAASNWYGLEDERIWAYLGDPDGTDGSELTIENGIYYDEESHTVYWVINDVPAQKQDYVNLLVRVNDKAKDKWDYSYNGHDRDGTATAGQTDFEVFNRATVQVGNDSELFTSTKQNSIPDKDEMSSGPPSQPLVPTIPENGVPDINEDGDIIEHYGMVGQEITYQIHWKNSYDRNAEVKIEDILDRGNGGVDFVSAEYVLEDDGVNENVTLKAGNDSAVSTHITTVTNPDKTLSRVPTVKITFDENLQKVVWSILDRPGGSSGFVTLVVRVNVNAVRIVENQATVYVDNNPARTNILENPVPDNFKEETWPGNNALVKEGDRISYEIGYQNYNNDPATVIIRDPLDNGVDFLQAGMGSQITDTAQAIQNWNGLEDDQKLTLTGINVEDGAEVAQNIYYSEDYHTVYWVIKNVPGVNDPNSAGVVTLNVTVNDQATKTWNYNENATGANRGGLDGTGQDFIVYNRASIQVGHDSEQFTKVVQNPLDNGGEPSKEETKPGDGKQVEIGDEITYLIHWINTETVPAAVTIEDPLDPGVDFVSSDTSCTYSGCENGHKVTWNLGTQEPGISGTVELVVRVNKDAYTYWQYGSGDDPVTVEPGRGDGKDYEVVNRASIQVGNNPKQYTNIPENPVPEKTEIQAGNDSNPHLEFKQGTDETFVGPLVGVGQNITYEITWKNESEPGKVEIADTLDSGVDFVSARFKDNHTTVSLSTSNENKSATDGNYSIALQEEAGEETVVWTIENCPANAEGTVILEVKVNSEATEKGVVDNQAQVTIKNETKKTTIVENPTPEAQKTETKPGDGKRVEIGDQIDYRINWDANGQSDEEAELDVITITDPLDPGADFVSASYGGVTLKADKEGATVKESSGVPADPENPDKGDTITIEYDADSHTVIWTLKGAALKIEGYVDLSVKVNAKALTGSNVDYQGYDEELAGEDDDWKYREDEGLETEGNQLIQNRGTVNFNNDIDIVTQLVKNPTGPDKEEINPDQGDQVTIGDKITYEILYQNYEDKEASVLIRDPLDPGVDFVEASYKTGKISKESAEEKFKALSTVERSILLNGSLNENNPIEDGVYYSEKDHMVIWVFNKVASHYEDTVSLTVQVNKNAKQTWNYSSSEQGGEPGEGEDHQVLDRANVQVGNNPKIFTDILDNPVPEKTETKVDKDENPDLNQKEDEPNTEVGPVVLPGEEITYNIGWRNGETERANVIITDKLDPGVDFVSASFEGNEALVLTDETEGNSVSDENKGLAIKYDSTSRTVTWTLKNQAPGKNGNVILVVRANNKAQEAGYVDNQAKVQVGNDSKQTNIVENPTPEVEKEEVSPGDGKRVKVGSTINYQINWDRNDLDIEDDEDDKEIRTIVITDPLDPGVDFVSASYDGVTLEAEDEKPAVSEDTVTINGKEEPTIEISYDSESHTVIWTLRGEEAKETGTVDLTVRVNSKALLGSETSQNNTDLPGYEEKNWDYREGTGLETNNNQEVQNRGYVQFDNHPELLTDLMENPVGPEKEEVSPGDGKQVTVGEEINYEIEYQNIEENEATVIVRDPLDIGVDFISARINNAQETTLAQATKKFDEDLTLEQQEILTGPNLTGPNTEPSNVSIPTGIYYKDDERIVYWVIEDVPGIGEGTASQLAASAGKVQLKVKVNSNAKQTWNYDSDDRNGNAGSGQDNQVVDRATVQVGNNPEFYTNTVDNPVPEKTETQVKNENGSTAVSPEAGNLKPGSDGNTEVGPLVQVGDEITYEISWKNGEDKEADVEISDTLDPGVDFVSASFKNLERPFLQASDINAGAKTVTSAEESLNLSIRYEVNNKDERTIIWSLGKRAAGESGTVVLVVKVNSQASVQGEVENEATVKVGNESKKTNKVENPTPQTEKKETNPGDGEKVKVGDIIDYQIKWDRNGTQAGEDETLQTIQITDPLDPGVDFYSAGYDSLTLIAANSDAAYQNDVISAHSNVEAEDGYTIEISYNKATHTVIWIIKGAALKTEGFVDLKVKVTERALVNSTFKPDSSDGSLSGSEENWEYRDEGGIEKNSGQLAQNRALVKFNNDSDILTDLQKNPLLPVKEEVSPGEGEQVKIGDEIHYQIFWHNYKSESASVVVEDRLDAGVDFARAEFNGTILYSNNLQSTETSQTVTIPNGEQSVIKPLISYDAETHMVTWNLGVQPANSDGVVDLYVKVNSKASQYWQYGQGDEPETTDPDGEGTDFEVVNRAAIQVGNDSKIYTDIIENPTPKQEKTEVNPGAGHQVMPGDQVDYEINWTNYKDKPAVVKVRDALDPGVNFKSARFGSVELTWNQGEGTASQKPAQTLTQSGQATLSDGTKIPVTISYDPARHEIVWILGNESTGVPARMDGKVEHSVLVNDEAKKLYTYDEQGNIDSSKAGENDKQILNQGGITVGNDAEILTNIIPNPTEPLKDATEVNESPSSTTTVGDVKYGPEVKVGDVITYTITWQNNVKDENGEGEMADVTVVDTFKTPGLEFVAAGFVETTNGQDLYSTTIPQGWSVAHEGETTRWIIPKQAFGARGKVWIRAKVLTEAGTHVRNGAEVIIGDEHQIVNDVVHPLSSDASLTVTKTVTGEGGDTSKDWNFTVSLTQRLSGTYGDMTFADGVASFTLKSGESKSASGLPAGIGYSVKEAEANQDGYSMSSSQAEGNIPESGTAKAAFVNHKESTTTSSNTTPGNNVSTTSDSKSANTGDNSRMSLWIALMIFSLAGLAAIGISTYRKRDRS